ncbi:MAG TPA: GNAT family N-acetyltransferase [Burkholderiaceae bacterium]|nr:GNAT family N-acetyltransferase [Burkholderiaceae bacterium]
MSRIKQPAVHNETAQRFEVTIDGALSRADYRLQDGVMHMVHTEVPVRQEGRGIAAMLVRAALEYARAQGYRVRPACSYVRNFMARNCEFDDLRADAPRGR